MVNNTERLSATARWALLNQTLRAAAEPGQPLVLYTALDQAFSQLCGHKLFTLMTLHWPSGEAERVYSSQPDAYPVSGRKQLVDTPWFRQVIDAKQHYLGSTEQDIRWAFADHERIKQLGCGSVLNVLVCYNGQVLGSANLLHQEHHYRAQDIEHCVPFAQLLATPFGAR